MLDAPQLDFIADRRTATLVTLSDRGNPRPVPICFVLERPHHDAQAGLLYSPLDEKPKRSPDVRVLARVRDIQARPDVTLLFDRWSEDWSQLAWVRVHGSARLIDPGSDPDECQLAVRALRAKYPQYLAQRIDGSPLIRVEIDEARSWSAVPDLL